MEFRFPSIQDESILQDYVEEHRARGLAGISASADLENSDFKEWIAGVRRRAAAGEPGRGRSLLYLCLDGSRLVGLLSIRWELPPDLADREGHIGYSVRPSRRGKGYATAMLRYGLEVCREKGRKEVILGCYRDNPASAAVIRRNGGILIAEEDRYTKGRVSQYFVIPLDAAHSPRSAAPDDAPGADPFSPGPQLPPAGFLSLSASGRHTGISFPILPAPGPEKGR